MYSSQSVSALYAFLFDSSNNTPPPVTDHSDFSSDTAVLNAAKLNYASDDGMVMATYIALGI
jgi:hypothetical protein